MIELDLVQGSPEWLAHRANYRNASDTPAVTGRSEYKTRAAFMKERATGIVPEVDAATQRRFDDGHRFEALARPLMEEIIGEDLFPVVGVDGPWSASFDGLTMMGDVNAEHKALNDAIRACNSADELPPMYREQMEHQMMVSGATKSLFMATKWKKNDEGEYELEEEKHFWYLPNGALRQLVVNAWDQFEIDLANYQHVETKPAAVSEVIEDLPALTVQLVGQVTASNLATFQTVVMERIKAINTALVTDGDFATADKMVKFLDDGEKRLELVKSQALSQTASIDELFRTIDSLKAEMRSKRLTLDKLVKAEKENRKFEIVSNAQGELTTHILSLQGRAGMLVNVSSNFAEAIKGLKSLDSMRDKVSVALANAKIEANAIADRIEANRKKVESFGDMSLFPDFANVCTKLPDDFAALLAMRVNARKEAEEKRMEAERERIRAEEQAKAQREAEAKMAAERAEANRIAAEELRKMDAERKAAEQENVQAVKDKLDSMTVYTASEAQAGIPVVEQKQEVADVSLIDEGNTIKLGEICSRLGFTITAEFLASLGYRPVATDKNAKLYAEVQFRGICSALVQHISNVAVGMKKAA